MLPCERAFAEAQRFGEARLIADAEGRLPWFTYMSGEWAQARALTSRLVDSASPWARPFYLWAHGMMAVATGDEGAIQSVEPLYLAEHDPTDWLLITAAAADGQGDDDTALTAASKAMDIMEQQPLFLPFLAEFIWVPALYHRVAGLIRDLPDGEWKQILSFACEGRYAEAVDLLTGVGAIAIAAHTHLFAASKARDDGRSADVKPHAAEALRFYTAVGATRFAERASALMHA